MRISRCTRKEIGGTIRQVLLHRVLTPIESTDLLQETNGFQLMHRPGTGLISCLHRITSEAEKIANPKRMGTQ